MRKRPTKEEKAHLDAILHISCICCGSWPVEAHHIRDHTGLSCRASNFDVIPLCSVCHRTGDGKAGSQGRIGYHHSPKDFTERYGSQAELLAKTRSILENNF